MNGQALFTELQMSSLVRVKYWRPPNTLTISSSIQTWLRACYRELKVVERVAMGRQKDMPDFCNKSWIYLRLESNSPVVNVITLMDNIWRARPGSGSCCKSSLRLFSTSDICFSKYSLEASVVRMLRSPYPWVSALVHSLKLTLAPRQTRPPCDKESMSS